VRDYLYIARRQLSAWRERVVPATFADGDRAPVVVLPGVLEPWTLMLPIAERLHARGHPIHVVDALAINTVSVEAAAALVELVLRERDLRGVVIVAHSKGGLIGKRLLIDDADGRIAQLIAIATPWHGSSLARYVPGRVIGALRPDDAAIVALAANTEVNARITAIFPALDQHVPEGSVLEGATNVEVSALGHFRVLSDPETLDAVVAAVGR
jgi:pimeloyl-ACP methyl ester carboxylesterase